MLLAAGADINGRNKAGDTGLISACSGTGWNLLGRVFKEFVEGAVDEELKEKADLTGRRSMALVRMFLDRGVDVNAQNHKGEMALMKACDSGDLEIVRVLLAQGADIHAKNAQGQTALDLAKAKHYSAVARILLERGKRIWKF